MISITEKQDLLGVTYQQLQLSDGNLKPRIILPAEALYICHDVVNDKVIISTTYHNGLLSYVDELPKGIKEASKPIEEALKTHPNIVPKSVTLLNCMYDHSEVLCAPQDLYYITFDSRGFQETDELSLRSAKELIKEVRLKEQTSPTLILASMFLKLTHNNLRF